ncbi:MAG: hypothetical protein Aurels2KO_54960 [Aureliella sp.]
MSLLDFLFPQPPQQPPYGLLDALGLDESSLSTHFFLCGETGAGKTTILKQLLYAYLWLMEEVGAVHACVKADEYEWVVELVGDTPMAERLLHLKLGEFQLNVAGEEMSREGGSPETLARLLLKLNRLRRRSKGGDSEQSFWENLYFDYLHYAAITAFYAHGRAATIEHLYEFIHATPNTRTDAKKQDFMAGKCWQMLLLAQEQTKGNAAGERAIGAATEFVLFTQTGLGSKARQAGVQECSSILGPFLMSPFYETFCQPASTFTPDTPLQGYYTLLDFPVLTFGPTAQLAQSLIITLVVEAALRQTAPELTTMIIRDEVQMLVTDPFDETMWHSVARSHGLSFWSAVQNVNLLTTAFSGDEVAMKSWVANLATKFACANTCMDTNKYFSTLFGQHKEHFHNFSERQAQEPSDGMQALFGDGGFQFGSSTSYADRVPVDHFLHLKRGGPPDYQVKAYMSGRACLASGLPYQLVTFDQE